MLRTIALALALAGPAAAQSDGPTLLDAARQDGRFGTFLAAAEAAGLSDALESDGPFTIFAPTDAAFAALPDGRLEELMNEENRVELTEVVSYHVVPEEVPGDELEDGAELGTVNGATLPVSVEDGATILGNATVAAPGIVAGNGILHAVDAVIVPPE